MALVDLVQYIYKQDGFFGLYRGFGCSLFSKVVCLYTTTKIDEVDHRISFDRKIFVCIV